MIRLATVFSGIGAIEHALDRMGVKHKIVFACDNGDVDILTKEIDQNIDKIEEEINILNLTIFQLNKQIIVEDLYLQQLAGMFNEMTEEYGKIKEVLSNISEPLSNIKEILIRKIYQRSNCPLIKVEVKDE